jgi:hypothetical protein
VFLEAQSPEEGRRIVKAVDLRPLAADFEELQRLQRSRYGQDRRKA